MPPREGTIFEDILYYKPRLTEVIARYQALYAAREPGHLCTFVIAPHRGEPLEYMPLTAIDWEAPYGLEEYIDLSLRNMERIWRANRELADDNIPTAGLNIGIGEYSAYVAGEVVFQEDTSWATPAVYEWADLDGLELDYPVQDVPGQTVPDEQVIVLDLHMVNQHLLLELIGAHVERLFPQPGKELGIPHRLAVAVIAHGAVVKADSPPG